MPGPGAIRRIRQACTNCRSRKTKCSGDRPKCNTCRRDNRSCQYEPYTGPLPSTIIAPKPQQYDACLAVDRSSSLPTADASDGDLFTRIRNIEAELARLGGRNSSSVSPPPTDQSRRKRSSSFSIPRGKRGTSFSLSQRTPRIFESDESQASHPTVESTSPRSSIAASSGTRHLKDLPPTPVMDRLIDAYFLHVHNQPYSYFHEDSFRQRLAFGTIPKCLIFAILASTLRFSNDDYFQGSIHEATDIYAREAWLSVLDDYMSSENSSNLHVAQTINMLAIIDFTSGRTSSGWLKIGMAVRIAQDLQLMKEPNNLLPVIEQEERRRVFWSIYLLDKLVSCGQGRPPALSDEDCQVNLPYSEETFKNGGFETATTLRQIFSWDTNPDVSCSPLSLVILTASALGRCARYVLHERETDELAPWDPKSEFTSINSFLMLAEHHIQGGGATFDKILTQYRKMDQSLDQQQVGHLLFSRVLFHVCHCLLNHPPLLRLRLQKLHCKVSSVFLTRTIQTSCEHACHLAKLLDAAASAGCHVQSSFYAYAAFLAGTILSIVIQSQRRKNETPSVDLLTGSQQALRILENMGNIWDHASKMHLKALLFDSHSNQLSELLDASNLANMNSPTKDLVWSIVDYGAMVSEVRSEQYLDFSHAETSFMSLDLGLDLGLGVTTDCRSNLAEGELTETMSGFGSSSDVQYLL